MIKLNISIKRLLPAILFVVLTASVVQAKMMSVRGRRVNMRSGPSTKYAVLWELGKGYPLKIVAKNGKWVKIMDFEGDVGWIYKALLSNTPHLIVKKDRVIIRSGPATSYRIKGKANYGVVFRTLKHRKGWVKVKHEDGLVGWVKRDLVWGW